MLLPHSQPVISGLIVVWQVHVRALVHEVLGLCWQDIDFKNQMLRVRNGLVEDVNGLQLDKTKTEHSVRDIPLEPSLYRALEEQKSLMQAEAKLRGEVLTATSLVFPTSTGNFTALDCLAKALNRLVE